MHIATSRHVVRPTLGSREMSFEWSDICPKVDDVFADATVAVGDSLPRRHASYARELLHGTHLCNRVHAKTPAESGLRPHCPTCYLRTYYSTVT